MEFMNECFNCDWISILTPGEHLYETRTVIINVNTIESVRIKVDL